MHFSDTSGWYESPQLGEIDRILIAMKLKITTWVLSMILDQRILFSTSSTKVHFRCSFFMH